MAGEWRRAWRLDSWGSGDDAGDLAAGELERRPGT